LLPPAIVRAVAGPNVLIRIPPPILASSLSNKSPVETDNVVAAK